MPAFPPNSQQPPPQVRGNPTAFPPGAFGVGQNPRMPTFGAGPGGMGLGPASNPTGLQQNLATSGAQPSGTGASTLASGQNPSALDPFPALGRPGGEMLTGTQQGSGMSFSSIAGSVFGGPPPGVGMMGLGQGNQPPNLPRREMNEFTIDDFPALGGSNTPLGLSAPASTSQTQNVASQLGTGGPQGRVMLGGGGLTREDMSLVSGILGGGGLGTLGGGLNLGGAGLNNANAGQNPGNGTASGAMGINGFNGPAGLGLNYLNQGLMGGNGSSLLGGPMANLGGLPMGRPQQSMLGGLQQQQQQQQAAALASESLKRAATATPGVPNGLSLPGNPEGVNYASKVAQLQGSLGQGLPLGVTGELPNEVSSQQQQQQHRG
ncbi:hypothetical protein HDU97_007366, partial [Phlyctochytrium planicorne]